MGRIRKVWIADGGEEGRGCHGGITVNYSRIAQYLALVRDSRLVVRLRRVTLNYLFPVHVSITANGLPESGYTCKVRDGFIDMQMWRVRYPDGQVVFESAKVPCSPIPKGFHGQQVSFRQRGKIASTTPEVQQTFDAWLKANTILQPDEARAGVVLEAKSELGRLIS